MVMWEQAGRHAGYVWLEFLFLTHDAFVSVAVAGVAHVSWRTVAVEHATDGVGVALRALSARVTDAGVVSVAEQTWKEHHVDRKWVNIPDLYTNTALLELSEMWEHNWTTFQFATGDEFLF